MLKIKFYRIITIKHIEGIISFEESFDFYDEYDQFLWVGSELIFY